jgi:Rps23 Pro-64 3,4-dihydroxylase Tpa1-like proline 4-hydroxylase
MDSRSLSKVASWPSAESYRRAEPFCHAVIDDFLRREVAEELARAFPSPSADCWHQYSNRIERKLACNIREKTPPRIWETLEFFNSDDCRKLFSQLTGIEGLQSDPQFHGGGMHCIAPGGKLDIHIDYSIHPALGLERRLNLILYLNEDWDESWGGHLQLWNAAMTQCVNKIAPHFNRAVIFDTGDRSFHGHPDPLNCPPGRARKSLAVYYLTTPRDGATERYRARFVARPEDSRDAEIEELRRLRSGLTTGASVYRTAPKT